VRHRRKVGHVQSERTSTTSGDGTTNTAAGEQCDTTASSAKGDTTARSPCGDGPQHAAREQCDTSGQSATCDANCTLAHAATARSTAPPASSATPRPAATCDAQLHARAMRRRHVQQRRGRAMRYGGASGELRRRLHDGPMRRRNHEHRAGEQCDTSGQERGRATELHFRRLRRRNAQRRRGEGCEGANLNGQSCSTLGFGSGTLACSGTCNFDTSAARIRRCAATASPKRASNATLRPVRHVRRELHIAACGDGTTNSAAGEQMRHQRASRHSATRTAPRSCGDGTANSAAGEQCDGAT
jgi:hypothetical protein